MDKKGDYKNKYEIIKRIGRGPYTEVFKVREKLTNELKAIKIIKLDYIREELEKANLIENVDKKLQEYINGIQNEINNMKICGNNNENSVKFYESFESQNEYIIVLELCDESLTKLLRNKKRAFNPEEIYEIISQLNNTFKIMKENKIVHRDLKPDNILIKYQQKKYIVKLCDYGISKIGNFTHLNTHTGTTYYMAPEIMELTEENNYNYKCDLWSLGIIIYELFFKEKPYKGITEHAILEEIKRFGKKKLRETGNFFLDDLIKKLLEKDPKERITWDEYFNHSFFNEISIIYTKEYKNDKEIKIFGKNFVENNYGKCKILYKRKYYDLMQYFIIDDNAEKIEIKLDGISNITNFSWMFSGCNSLVTIKNIQKLDTNKVSDMSYMFSNCSSLKILPDISKWDTINVITMKGLFSNCNSLKNLPDISKWKTNKLIDISEMFYNCTSLISLPDISKWNTKRVISINKMFHYCKLLNNLPDISLWDTKNIINMSNLFNYCESLIELPDISKWNLAKVINICNLFYYCKSLKSLPDISKWNTTNIINMSGMFYYCESLTNLPDISKWNMENVNNISFMFRHCKSLETLPDISKWNIRSVDNMSELFYHCDSLKTLPDISKWNTINVTDMNNMFSYCNSLESICQISKWNISNVIDMHDMFYGCNNYLKNRFKLFK